MCIYLFRVYYVDKMLNTMEYLSLRLSLVLCIDSKITL